MNSLLTANGKNLKYKGDVTMSRKFKVKCKKALFLNDKQITDYIYDELNVHKEREIIIATTSEGKFHLYDYEDGKLLFKAEHYSFFWVDDGRTITLSIEEKGKKLWGVISFKGEVIIPFKFSFIKPTVYYDKVFEVETFTSEKGYYMTKTNQLIIADDIKKPNGVEYDFLIDNKWKRYSFISGIYDCIN